MERPTFFIYFAAGTPQRTTYELFSLSHVGDGEDDAEEDTEEDTLPNAATVVLDSTCRSRRFCRGQGKALCHRDHEA